MTVRNLVTPVLDRIVDADGIPVTGTITAYIKGTQSFADIRDVEGTVLANPLNVTDGICTPFITSTDLTIVLKDSGGSILRTTTWLYPTIGITTEGTDIPAYDTMVAMMAAEATGPVFLMGYNEAGDKPAKVYVGLTERSTETPDGGYLVRGVYHDFIMVDNVIDTRDYGMFPSVSSVEAHDAYNASVWASMVSKANALGTRLNISTGYYEVPPNLDIHCSGSGTLCPNGNILNLDIGSYNIKIDKYWNGTEYASGSVGNLFGETFTVSNGHGIPVSSYEVNKLYVDGNYVINAHDCGIEFTVTHTANRNLNNCTIYSASRLSDAVTEVYKNCELSQTYFTNDYSWAGTYIGCQVGQFTDTQPLAKFQLEMGNIVDLKGMILGSAGLVTPKAKVIICNGTITGTLTMTNANAELELVNVSCTSSSYITGASKITAINSQVLGQYDSAPITVINEGNVASSGTIHGNVIEAGSYSTEPMSLKKSHGTSIGVTGKYKFVRGTDYIEVTGYVPQVNMLCTSGSGDERKYVIGYWEDGGVHKNVYAVVSTTSGNSTGISTGYKVYPYSATIGTGNAILYWRGNWVSNELGSETYDADY